VSAYANPGCVGSQRVLTLGDAMEKFQAANWFEAMGHLAAMESLPELPTIDLSNPPATLDAAVRAAMASAMEGWEATFQRFAQGLVGMGCQNSAASARRIALAGRLNAVDTKALREGVKELRGRLADDLKLPMFFVLTPREGDLYESASAGGAFTPSVADAFPSAIYDIEEATKCLALGRSTASVFHLMRTMEVALRVISRRLPSARLSTDRNWNGLIERAQKVLDAHKATKDATWKRNGEFYSDLLARLRAVKDVWRNPTMHVERSYSPDEAAEVWTHVASFMKLAATNLRERKSS
jgi:hypothetical protein